MASESMMAVVTTGVGGYDRLQYRQVPIPRPAPGQVLLKVLAAGINNTDINTRVGWYSSDGGTGTPNDTTLSRAGAGWNGATSFPLIQGADCCGRVVSVGSGVDERRIGRRVLVRSCMRAHRFGTMDTIWLGSDLDGAFAQYLTVPADEVFAVESDWTDAELASIPCAYGTAENMLHRAGVREGMTVLVTGASGGVGSAVVQLAQRRGAQVVAITSASKRDLVRGLGADRVLGREDDPVETLGTGTVDIVIDNVAGPAFGLMLDLLRRGGRYVSSGAIAGPLVSLDMRKLYLKDIALIGCTAWDEPVFPNLVGYIERGEIKPLLAATYPLDRIAEAQKEFEEKQHVGKIVLVPPA